MPIKENRKLALAVLAVCVLISVFAFGGIALGREHGKVETVYTTGALNDGLSVKTFLTERGTEALKLAAIGAVYLGEDDADVKALQEAAEQINEATGIAERLAFSRNIENAQSMVYEKLQKAGLSDEDAREVRVYDRNITSAGQKMANDVFFENAASFNKTLRGFPANLISGLTGIEPLEIEK